MMRTSWAILTGLTLGGSYHLAGLLSATAKELPKLEIIRKAIPVVEEKTLPRPDDPDELITRIIVVPPTFLSIDAFVDKSEKTRPTAKQIFEAAGIPFPPGTSAIYNPATSQVIVRQPYDRMVEVESFLASIQGEAGTMAYFRFEIFQLPTALARKILGESKLKQDHSLERDSVLKLTATQQAKLISRVGLSVREGATTEFKEGPEHHFVVNYKRSKKSKHMLPVFESLNAGTKIFVRSIDSIDNSIVPFEFKFEHHFTEPEMRLTEIHIPKTQKIATLQLPELHSIQLSGTEGTVMKNNAVKIIGTYQSTFYDENQTPGQMAIVFLKASLRQIKK